MRKLATLPLLVLLSAACGVIRPPNPTPTPPPEPPPTTTPEPVCTPGHGDPGEHFACYAKPPGGAWVYVCPVYDDTGTVVGVVEAPGPEACPAPPTEPPPPPAGAACFLTTEEEAGGVHAVENPKPPQAYRDALRERVLVALEAVTGCPRGGTCLISAWTQTQFQAAVVAQLVKTGTCAAPKSGSGADQISVSAFEAGACSTIRQNYDVFLGDDHDIPVPPGTRRTVVWAKEQDAWAPNDPARNSDCTAPQPPPPTPQPPPDTGECGTPDPRGLKSLFVLKKHNQNGLWDSTFKVDDRDYCRQIPEFATRLSCPVRPECPPDAPADWTCHQRVPCERLAIGKQLWWCDGEPIPAKEGNSAQAVCVGHVTTATEDGRVRADADW